MNLINLLLIITAYALGSVSGSLVVGRQRGIDIRHLGSGNAGGTNALRTQGWKFALMVVCIDMGKGALVAALAQYFWPNQHALVLIALIAAVCGHIWPVFHGFRGGKGAATLVGGLVVLWPQAVFVLLAVWGLTLMLSGYVGLSSILAATSLLGSAYVFEAAPAYWWFAFSAAVLIAWTHRSNVQRMRQGCESRFEKARLLGRLFSRRG